ncbi:MAG: hypothetical protein IT330_01120 [Anaerolineae bacterium]|nr:hypothetical protein [Anaerolineae bacterium]
MAESKRLTAREIPMGDAAVDGLLAGVGAGLAMAVYVVAVGLASGEAMATILGRFAPGESASPLSGALLHLAVSGVYGLVFGLGRGLIARFWRHRLPGWLTGLAYGLLLLALAKTIILPGTGSALLSIPFAHFALAHIIYGLSLGYLVDRSDGYR